MQSKILSIIRMGCGEISLQIFNLKYIGVLKTCDLCPDLLYYKWVLWKVWGVRNSHVFICCAQVQVMKRFSQCFKCSPCPGVFRLFTLEGTGFKNIFFFLNVSKNAESDEPVIVLASLTALQEMLWYNFIAFHTNVVTAKVMNVPTDFCKINFS